MALLDVLAALAILSLTAATVVSAVASEVRATDVAAEREKAAVRRSELLGELTLLTGPELGARLGNRPVGAYQVAIARVRSGLYRIEVAGPLPEDAATLVTLVFRDPGLEGPR